MYINNKNKIIIGLAVVVLVLAAIAWFVYYFFFSFMITSARPNTSRVSTLAPVIVLKTNRTLSDQPIKFDDNEAGIVASVNVNGKDIIINLYQNLKQDSQYSIVLSDIQSNDGYSIESYTYSFSPVNNPSYLTDEDRKIISDRQESQKPSLMSDPVYIATPFQSNSYIVKSTLNATPDGKGSISLQATIYLTRDETAKNRQASIDSYKKQILDRLKDIEGFSESKYPITFVVQE